MRTLILALILLIPACRTSPERSHAAIDTPIREIVQAQEAAWNRGDIDGFMSAGYWRSPEMTFYSESDVTRGYEPVLERYTARYKTGGAEMGRLTFTQVDVQPLGPDAAFVRGRWDLHFGTLPPVGGLFTLVFRRIDGQWRIVHDHTSL